MKLGPKGKSANMNKTLWKGPGAPSPKIRTGPQVKDRNGNPLLTIRRDCPSQVPRGMKGC